MDTKLLRQEFKKHYEKYDTSDEMITLKYFHSMRVMDLAVMIGKYNSFNNNDLEIVTIAGLLHDYARFEQWTKYKTFSDNKSVDHGDLAVEMLFKNREIELYTNNKDNYDEIYDAIKYHNKYDYPDNLSNHNKEIAKVIRDADKLDIFYLFGIDPSLYSEDNTVASSNIELCFYNKESIKHTECVNKTDFMLLRLSMVFDLNYTCSYKYMYDNKLMDKMFNNIKDKDKYKKYFDLIKEVIEERMNVNVR